MALYVMSNKKFVCSAQKSACKLLSRSKLWFIIMRFYLPPPTLPPSAHPVDFMPRVMVNIIFGAPLLVASLLFDFLFMRYIRLGIVARRRLLLYGGTRARGGFQDHFQIVRFNSRVRLPSATSHDLLFSLLFLVFLLPVLSPTFLPDKFYKIFIRNYARKKFIKSLSSRKKKVFD